MEGVEMWEAQKNHPSEGFHFDPNKESDPVEGLIDKLGLDGAFDEITQQLENDPENSELRRQAALLVERGEELVSRLKGKLQH